MSALENTLRTIPLNGALDLWPRSPCGDVLFSGAKLRPTDCEPGFQTIGAKCICMEAS